MSDEKKKQKYLKLFLRVFAVIAIILTLFPFIPIEHWSIRVFDFPHLQLTLLTLMAFLCYFLAFDYKSKTDIVFIAVMGIGFFFQGLKIYPYTAFAKYEMQNASENSAQELRIYTLNVLQKNKQSSAVLKDVQGFDADILLFTETNRRWMEALSQKLRSEYQYKVEVPQENTYGMLLYSKYELVDPKVKYLVEDTIPSIHTRLVLPPRDTLQLFAIHPAPPTPEHNPTSVDRDAEMMKIARASRDSKYPVIALGDFNDVAWSETSALFQKASGLLDLRKGRGFYSTYNVNSWVMRWPLDHIFCSADFRVKHIELGADVGSDHFSFFSHLSLESDKASEQLLPDPSEEVLKRAFNQIEDENEEDKNPE